MKGQQLCFSKVGFKINYHMRYFVLLFCQLSGLYGYSQCNPGILDTQQKIDDFTSNYPGCTEPLSLFIKNTAVNNLNGLSQITSINGYFIVENTSIANFSGLNNLTQVGGEIWFFNNLSLASLDGLENLEIGSGGQTFGITNSPLLTNLNQLISLNNLAQGQLYFDNIGITDFTGLGNLDNVGGIIVKDNANLTSFTGLNPSLMNISYLFVEDNPILSNCATEGICQTLESIGIVVIENNASGCNSVTEFEAACLLLLPVELKGWTAELNNGNAILSWHTASQSNASHFTIQHSTNGREFYDIGTVPAHGTTTETHDYHFTHENPAPGNNYYRLKMVDLDGSFEYSKVVQVFVGSKKGGISIFPNPAAGDIWLTFDETATGERTISLFNLDGKMVYQRALLEDAAEWTIPGDGLPTGMYLLELRHGTGTIHRERLVKW